MMIKILSAIVERADEERGAVAGEYAVLLTLIAVALIVAIGLFTDAIIRAFDAAIAVFVLAILGVAANLGAGTKLANFRVFPGNVCVYDDGRLRDTGLLKLGALVGDDVQIDCNAVTAPGTVIGRGTRIYSLASVRGTIPPKTLVSYKPSLRQRPLRT